MRMPINLKRVLLLLLAVLLLPLGAQAYDAVPETVRIGLYYASTAKTTCNVGASGGILLSVANESKAWSLTQDESVNAVLVKKDATYHAELSDRYDTYQPAWERKTQLRAEGYPAYCAYADGTFRVWVGAYPTEQEARNAANALGASVLVPQGKRILVYVGDMIWLGFQDNSSYLTVSPITGTISVEGKEYRGSAQFLRLSGSDMSVVNVVGLDDYLCGVVPREMTPTWNYEAVKAQAVVAHTFAVTNRNGNEKYGFQLTPTSQVYAGVSAEHPTATQAIRETHNELVLYDGSPAQTYYFTSSGGRTATSSDVWSGTFPYLVSVSDSYESADATHAHWSFTYSPQELASKLSLQNLGEITGVETVTADSGFVLKTIIHGTAGDKTYNKEEIRNALGLYSTAFTVSRSGDSVGESVCTLDAYNNFVTITPNLQTMLLSGHGLENASNLIVLLASDGQRTLQSAVGGTGDFVFSGHGYGHCVGMSQWGAKGMAEAGFSYKEILQHYFTGTTVG